MKLVEPAIYRLLVLQGVTASMYIGAADGKSSFPMIVIRRINTATEHTKDGAAQAEEILIQVTSASDESMLLANDLDDQVTAILNNLSNYTVPIGVGLELRIKSISKENNLYSYDEELDVHHIHTDFLVRI